MTETKIFNITIEQLEEHINIGKFALLDYLINTGEISIETYDHCVKNIGLIIRKPSFFSNFWKKLIPSGKDERLQVIIIEQHTFEDPDKKSKNKPENTDDTVENKPEESDE